MVQKPKKPMGDIVWMAQLKEIFSDPTSIVGFSDERTQLVVSLVTDPFQNAFQHRAVFRIDVGGSDTAVTMARHFNASLTAWHKKGNKSSPLPGIRMLTEIAGEPVRPSHKSHSGGSAINARPARSL